MPQELVCSRKGYSIPWKVHLTQNLPIYMTTFYVLFFFFSGRGRIPEEYFTWNAAPYIKDNTSTPK